MKTNEAQSEVELGQRIRKNRLEKGLTVKAVAERVGVTSGFLSQVEHNRVAPSIDSLRRIARALGIPLFHLLIDDEVPSELVRSFERRRVSIPGRNLEYQVISSQPERKFGVMVGTLGPGESSGDEFSYHDGEECIVVQSGVAHVVMPHTTHELHEGDSLYFDASVPHRLQNRGDRPCVFMLILSPPRY